MDVVQRLRDWFTRCLFDIHGESPAELGGLLLGAPLWGEEYISRFERWCMSSLVATENAAALKGSRVVLFTDDDSAPHLVSCKRRLEGAGIHVLIRRIPPKIMAGIGKGNARFWLLGTVNNITVQMAARWGMGFHMLQPDHIYCADYFPKLLALGKRHHAMVQAALSVDLPAAAGDLGTLVCRHGAIEATAKELSEVAWDHLHPCTASRIIASTDILPASTWVAWRGEDRLVVMSPHHHPVWLSPHLCRFAPSRVPHTMDAELPRFMPFGFYAPVVSDGLVYIEASDGAKPGELRRMPVTDWSKNLWEVTKFRDYYLPIVATPVEIPIPHGTGLPKQEIERQRLGLLARHTAAKLAALETWSQRMIDD